MACRRPLPAAGAGGGGAGRAAGRLACAPRGRRGPSRSPVWTCARGPTTNEQLLAELRRYEEAQQRDWTEAASRTFASARTCLEKLAHVNAKDVLALRETWTDADTDLLRRLPRSKKRATHIEPGRCGEF
ncbi:unnamed protein product [Prorocentrum cordatum]|uniref:Uncharacterized protein n=1 Tax=Prorocentrum cordatum TaxID=2364126 RepID=A0ABN9UBG5_9DINO|nr:unnamed protein product [Polarella glacialis]